jgi:hypothetical protein
MNNLMSHKDFKWINRLYKEAKDDIANGRHIMKATISNEPKYQFGVEVPRSVNHAMKLDQEQDLAYKESWRYAIDTELGQLNEYKTFRTVNQGEQLHEYTRVPYHIVFAVKFDGRKKARLVAGGNCTDPPKEDIYSGVVEQMCVRLGYLIAETNGLLVCAGDVGNAFLHGTTREKVYIRAGPEFGKLAGYILIIQGGLYGLRSSSARFHEHLSDKIRKMGYRPTKADPDLWMKEFETHNEYIATYVDDVLSFSRDPMSVLEEFKTEYTMKGVGKPQYYLGGDIEELPPAWNSQQVKIALSAKTYIQGVVEKFEKLTELTFALRDIPMDPKYHPECDESEIVNPKTHSLYRGLIGSANWMVTLGRFDIAYAVSTLARHSMQPRKGHLDALIRVFGYVKKHPDGRIIVDPKPPDTSTYTFTPHNWTEFYPDAAEEIPPDMPTPKGLPIHTMCYVDADHAHDLVTRRSVTGILILANNMPMKWYSKRQKTVETSSYGSELVAARLAVEHIIEIRYKLRMLGVPLAGPTMMRGDNIAVVLNTTVPSSQLKKKHNAIAYHRVREAIAADIIQFVHIPSTANYADCLTKPLSAPQFERTVHPTLFRHPTDRTQEPS